MPSRSLVADGVKCGSGPPQCGRRSCAMMARESPMLATWIEPLLTRTTMAVVPLILRNMGVHECHVARDGLGHSVHALVVDAGSVQVGVDLDKRVSKAAFQVIRMRLRTHAG